MARFKPLPLTFGLALAASILSCGDDDNNTAPEPTPTLAPAPTKSGDQQQGPAGEQLASTLRVLVTIDGVPEPDQTVQWSASGNGSVSPTSSETDEEGIAETNWTLGTAVGAQTATATVEDATGSPVTFTATATSPEPPPPEGVTVQVLSGAVNRFSPATVTITAGQTVTWEWPAGSTQHNVAPDDGSVPARSGDPADGPTSYAYTFTTPGTYLYHCEVHGAAGGVGMAGTVIVQAAAP
jgi:plastocyanin